MSAGDVLDEMGDRMSEWLSQPTVLAAIIAAVFTLVGVYVNSFMAERRLKADIAGITAQISSQLQANLETQRQVQLTEVLKRRIETYPALYKIIAVYGRNWGIEGKPRDHAWAAAYLQALIDNNARNGAFFSNQVYTSYGNLRDSLEGLRDRLASGDEATEEDLEELKDIILGPPRSPNAERKPGLGSHIKDELGSYVTSIISATYEMSNARRDVAILVRFARDAETRGMPPDSLGPSRLFARQVAPCLTTMSRMRSTACARHFEQR